MTRDSLKKRYAYKLGASVLGAPISFFVQSIVARSLGPAVYGNFTFLTNFFINIVNFFELGSSQAFYNKICQKKDQKAFVFYWKFVALVFLFLFFATLFIVFSSLSSIILPDQPTLYIFMALFFGLFSWGSQIMLKVLDAYGLTREAEISRLALKFFLLFLTVAFYITDSLNLTTYFILQLVSLVGLCLAFGGVLRRQGIKLFPNQQMSFEEIKYELQGYFKYCSPLFFTSVFLIVVDLFDRWLIQRFSGAEQQGYFGLSFQVSSICFLIASPVVPLLGREFSIAISEKNIERMRSLYDHHVPLFFVITGFISSFFAFQSESLLFITGGAQFENAYWVVFFMSLYPIYQIYGQLGGTVLFVLERTNYYRNSVIAGALVGSCVTLFFFLPKSISWFNNGALCLAIKTIVSANVSTAIILYYNSKLLGLSFRKSLFGKWKSVFIFLVVGHCSKFLSKYFFHQSVLLSFFVSSLLYFLVIFLILLRFPNFLGIELDFKKFKKSCRRMFFS